MAHLRAFIFTKPTKINKTSDPYLTHYPLVSVIVPARNEGQYIKRCLVSILSQRYRNLEVIVVDDNSNDDTTKIAESIQDNRLKIINLKTTPTGWTGKSWASQVGYLASAGKLLLFTDADSFFYNKDAISRVVSFMQRENINVVTGLPLIELADIFSKLVMPIYNLFSILYAPSTRDLNNSKSDSGHLVGSFFMINKQILDKIGGFQKVRHSIQEDTDLGIIIKKAGSSIALIKVNNLVAALWSRDTRTLVDGIRRIVSYNLANSPKNLVLDTCTVFFLITLPFLLLIISFSLESSGTSHIILLWNILLSALPCFAVATIGRVKHCLNFFYSASILFSSSLYLTLYLVNFAVLKLLPISNRIHWKGRKYRQPREESVAFTRRPSSDLSK